MLVLPPQEGHGFLNSFSTWCMVSTSGYGNKGGMPWAAGYVAVHNDVGWQETGERDEVLRGNVCWHENEGRRRVSRLAQQSPCALHHAQLGSYFGIQAVSQAQY